MSLPSPNGTPIIPSLEDNLNAIISQYQLSFSAKEYREENSDHDVLMDAFGITPSLKRENRQYWGRELGMCWQLLVTQLCREKCQNFAPAIRYGLDSPYDLAVGNLAIDTKYRIGSGDAGTLKKFKAYGPLLIANNYKPVLLIVREDNLESAINACRVGEWEVIIGQDAFTFLYQLTGYDLKDFLIKAKGKFPVVR